VTEESLFEIPKPISTKGIGVDQLPKHVFETSILSKNQIARLGNVEKIPTNKELIQLRTSKEVKNALQILDKKKQVENLHLIVKIHIENNDIELALKTLFSLK
jgi:hypothetical protein